MMTLRTCTTLLLALVALSMADPATAQAIPFIKATQITRWKNANTDTVYVLNFWASWCGPCIAELPHFERLHQQYAARKVQVVLISTDFRRDVERKLQPFVQGRQLKSQVVFIDEPNPNDWINLVSPKWSGTIPATLIISKKKGYTRFIEGKTTWKKLEKAVKKAL